MSLWREIKNRLYLQMDNLAGSINYIDSKTIIEPGAKIRRSELHAHVRVGNRSMIYRSIVSGTVTIGCNTTLWGPNIVVESLKNPISIGNFCSIARDVTILEYFHDYSKVTTYYAGRNIFEEEVELEVDSKGPIIIGHDVWIGTGVQITSGVTIGHGAVIAANSTVTKDIPPYAIAGGVPAKIIKYRFEPEIIQEFLKINWWDWDLEKIKRNKAFMTGKVSIDLVRKYNNGL